MKEIDLSVVPYASADYYTENFRPNELKITKESIQRSERLVHKDEIEFIYIYEGYGNITINGSLFPVSAGNLLLLMPYHIRAFQLKENEQLSIYRITFSIGLLLLTSTNRKTYLAAVKQANRILPVMILNTRQEKQVRFICEEIFYEKSQINGDPESLNIALVAILTYVFKKNHYDEKIMGQKRNISWAMLEFLQMHHQTQLTIDDIATALAISKKDVQHDLKQLTGVSFSENLNRVRIRNAVALLQFEELSVQQISRICGYRTEANFYKAFKRLRGMTPYDFRIKMLDESFGEVRMDAWEIYIYIQENYQKELYLKTIAQALNIPEKKINRLLIKTFDKTFKEMLTTTRLLMAKNLLLSLKITIKEVSQQVGFADETVFSRNFKKYYGETPKQFALKYGK